jgi:hypothetical protein
VTVGGTGDCLHVHDQPAIAAPVSACIPDGTTAIVAEGPVQADGYTWWWLNGLGWVAADYLLPSASINASPPAAAPAAAPVGASAAGATPAAGTPTAPSPPSVAAPPVTVRPVLPVGVVFATGDIVEVIGTADCLNVHARPSASGEVLECLPEGTAAAIVGGPVDAGGTTWWELGGHGWVDGDYLVNQPNQVGQ